MSTLVNSVAMTGESTSLGTAITPGVNQPFSLQSPEHAWLVVSGHLDLYLMAFDSGDGETKGARHFITRLEMGAGAMGFPLGEPGQIVVGVASPGTSLRRFTRQELQAASTGPQADDIRTLIENWVEQISSVAFVQTPPKAFQPVEADTNLKVGFNSQAVIPKQGVVWVQQIAGASAVPGEPDHQLQNGDWFPISRYGWLQSSGSTQLKIVGWAALQADDPTWSGLYGFQQTIFTLLVRNQAIAAADECDRLKTKAEADEVALESALTRLAEPLQTGTSTVVFDAESLDDPLLRAAQAVGRRQGLHVKPHDGMRRGLKPKDPVAAMAKASSLRTRRVLLKDRWWTEDCGPLLAFRDRDNRPMALLPRGVGAYNLYDPVDRSTVPVTQAVASSLNGFAYVFYRPFPETKLTAKELVRFGLFGCKRDVQNILLMGVGAGLLGMVPSIVSGVLFDTIIPGANRGQLTQMAVILLACAISTALFSITQSFALLRLEGKLAASVQAAVWDRLLNLPVPFFRNYTAGDLAVRGMGINQMRQVLTGSALSSILSGIFAVFSFALLFYYSSHLALIATGLIAAAFLVSLACGYFQVGYQREMASIRGHISGFVLQLIAGIAKLRVSGAEKRAFAIWAGEFTNQKLISFRSRKVQNHLAVFTAVFPAVCSMFIFYFTARAMADPKGTPLSTGDFVAFNSAFTQFLLTALRLSSAIVSVLAIVPLYERAKPIFETLPETTIAKSHPGDLSGSIEVNHIVFRYRDGTPLVLRDLSLSIPAGQFVAIVGPSGSGKSTLFRMLLGFERPESGSVYYDGQDLAGLDLQAVRRQIGVVLQNGRLFSGDVFTNIVGSAPLTIDDAWEAARLAGLDQDLKSMPMGMHTVVSEGGGGLSGGQRQRLMIARAIVGKPRLLLFDEATSALDNQTQSTVSSSLQGLKATRVVIAHRLSTILHADRIFVLDKGVIVQSGTYPELIGQPGLFAELAKRQLT